MESLSLSRVVFLVGLRNSGCLGREILGRKMERVAEDEDFELRNRGDIRDVYGDI